MLQGVRLPLAQAGLTGEQRNGAVKGYCCARSGEDLKNTADEMTARPKPGGTKH
jgi:hypothetical protein